MALKVRREICGCLFATVLAFGGFAQSSPPAVYVMTTVAGTDSTYVTSGPANQAVLINPMGIAAAPGGEIYVVNYAGCVQHIGADGNVTVVVGQCLVWGFAGDGGQASGALLNRPYAVATDSKGNYYIADSTNFRVRRVNSSGIITTYAGNGDNACTGDGGPAASAGIGAPTAMAIDSHDNMYLNCGSVIRKITPDGIISSLTTLATYLAGTPRAMVCDRSGNLYVIKDSDVFRVAADGTVTLVAGGGREVNVDGIPATNATLSYPTGLAVDSGGNVYIADTQNNSLRKVDASGIISTIAGNGVPGDTGDGGPASAAQTVPGPLAFDSKGNLLVSDLGGIRRIIFSTNPPQIQFVAGAPRSFRDGPAATAIFGQLAGITRDRSGNLYVADNDNNRIRKLTPDRMVTTVAGNSEKGFAGDGMLATLASLSEPWGVAFDSKGNLWIGDGASRVRKVTPGGVISTAATFPGVGTGYVAIDPQDNPYVLAGNLYYLHNEVMWGTIEALSGGTASAVKIAPGSPNPYAYAAGLAFDPAGNLYFATADIQHLAYGTVIQKLDSQGNVTTVAGKQGQPALIGDGGPAAAALLLAPSAMTFDTAGNLYFLDGNPRQLLRKITAQGALVQTLANVPGLVDIVVDPSGTIYATQDNKIVKFTPVPAALLSILAGNNQTVVGTQAPQSLTVALLDATGKIGVPFTKVHFAVTSGAASLNYQDVTTDPGGQATVGVTFSQPGPVVVTASVPGVPSATFRLAEVATAPAQLNIVSGNGQSGAAGAALPSPLVAKVVDKSGVPIAGVAVGISVTAGSATLSSNSGFTAADGTISVTATLGPSPGATTVTVVVTGLTPVQFQMKTVLPPAISPGGVVSSAGGGPSLAPGSLATIYGTSFTTGQAQALNLPLPMSLAGVSVTISGRPAPLLFAGANQINFQIPYEIPAGTANIVVTAKGIAGPPATVAISSSAPGIFTYGNNWAAVQNADGAVNSVSTPAKAGSYITVYATGGGAMTPPVATGTSAPDTPGSALSYAVANVTASVGGFPATVAFAGLAPGYVGVLQVNLQIPSLPAGTYPLQIRSGSSVSNSPSIAVTP